MQGPQVGDQKSRSCTRSNLSPHPAGVDPTLDGCVVTSAMAKIAPLLLAAGALYFLTRGRKEAEEDEAAEPSNGNGVEPPTGLAPDQLPPMNTSKDMVAFSEDGSKYAISPGWRIRVLDKWLGREYDECRIVTKYSETLAEEWDEDPGAFYGDGELALDIMSVAWLGAGYAAIKFLPIGKAVSAVVLAAEFIIGTWSSGLALEPFHKEAIESTGAGAAARFMEFHTVQVGETEGVKIIDLDLENENVQDFVKIITDYVAHFQSREFSANDASKSCKP